METRPIQKCSHPLWVIDPSGNKFCVECGEPSIFNRIEHLNQTIPDTEPVLINLPKFPGWEYTGEYRRPRDGEYFLYCGKVDCSRGRQALPYHILRRA